jgi:hypothetical protein
VFVPRRNNAVEIMRTKDGDELPRFTPMEDAPPRVKQKGNLLKTAFLPGKKKDEAVNKPAFVNNKRSAEELPKL